MVNIGNGNTYGKAAISSREVIDLAFCLSICFLTRLFLLHRVNVLNFLLRNIEIGVSFKIIVF